jgi:primosomal protein N'
VIIDEEQYESHKLWDQYPRLYAVRGAMQLSHIAGAELVLGSSYPSIALRYAMASGTCDVVHNNPIALKTNTISLSFEDRKWKRPVPDDLGRNIRAWARAGKTVLVFFNKREVSKVRETLHWKLSAQARERVQIGTSAILARAEQLKPDYVVWLFPELTMRAIDYRSGERTRILAARLQCLTPKRSIEIATRYQDAVVDILTLPDDAWYTKILKERSLLSLPPITDLVRLTIRDVSAKKALNRAIKIRELIEPAISKKDKQHIFGPYQEKGISTTRRSKEQVVEYFILLSGKLDDLVSLYADLPVDSADIDPHRVV